jgi:YHS domain-containing protein
MNKPQLKIFLILLFALIAPTLVQAQPRQAQMCLVMPGHKVRPQFYVDHGGERIYMCCRNCVKAFKKHPERYLTQSTQEH